MQRIGFIDWIGEKISLYVFEKKGSQYTLVDTVSVSLDGDLNQSAIMPLAKTSIEHTYLSVPVRLLSIRELSLPFTDENKIKDTIPYELEGLLLGEISNYCIDHLVIDSSKGGSKVLTASMEKARLRDMIDIFSSVGLGPEAITSIDLRLLRAEVRRSEEQKELASVLLHFCTSGLKVDEEIRVGAVREELVNPSINLMKEELSYKGDVERLRKSLRITASLALILLIIFSADTFVRLVSIKKENTLLTKEINALYHDTFPVDTKIVDAVRQFKGNFNVLRERQNILAGIPLLDILLRVAELKKQNITLYEFNVDGKNIFLKGLAASFEDVDSFKNVLSSSFMDVKVMDSKESSGRKINFSIAMKNIDEHR